MGNPDDAWRVDLEQLRGELGDPVRFWQRLSNQTQGFTKPALLRLTPGIGKTTAVKRLAASVVWRSHFKQIVIFVQTREQINELARELLDTGVDVVTYPTAREVSCPYGSTLERWSAANFGVLAGKEFCNACPNRGDCRYPDRRKRKLYRDHTVVLLPDQLLNSQPTIVEDLFDTEEVLVVIDEAKSADAGFVQTFTQEEVRRDIDCARACGEDEIAYGLKLILMRPGERLEFCSTGRWGSGIGKALFNMASHARDHYGPGERLIVPLARNYANTPLWQEDGTFAVQSLPVLPAFTLIIGAYLDPHYLSRRYQVPVPVVLEMWP